MHRRACFAQETARSALDYRVTAPPRANVATAMSTALAEKLEGVAILFDASFYRAFASLPASIPDDVAVEHFITRGSVNDVSPHPLFDVGFYRRTYQDVRESSMSAFEHFVRFGVYENRRPHPLFDPFDPRSSQAAPGIFLRYLSGELDARGVDPHPLFQTQFYRSKRTLPDGVPALVHYVTHGWRQGLTSHPLFDQGYYLTSSPDIAAAGMIPLVHFLEYGGLEGRDPCDGFSSAYYLATYPDVRDARLNPLVHYVTRGYREGRNPNARFHAVYYAERYLDGSLDVEPLAHYTSFGRSRGYSTSPPATIKELFPEPARVAPSCHEPVNVIVPVYRGLAETKACIESVIAAGLPDGVTCTIINDASPEPEVTEYLRGLHLPNVTVLENDANRGFVGTVNRGMRLAGTADVVLLNSDTIVSNDWIARLQRHAYENDAIASVTPLSNNATICSFPIRYEANELPDGYDAGALDRLLAAVNAGRSVQTPTAVGFCMYIRRQALETVGLFDEEAFGRGYGEENDFCLRALASGWKHLIALDAFVYHAGSVSFQAETNERSRAAMMILRERYPHYEQLLARHSIRDADRGPRMAAALAMLRRSEKVTILFVNHNFGGGTKQHADELASFVSHHANVLVLEPADSRVRLRTLVAPAPFDVTFDVHEWSGELLAILRSAAIDRVHIHHVMGHVINLQQLISELAVPFDFTIHDYFAICPQVTLTDASGVFCGEPPEATCNACIDERPPAPFRDIASWRSGNAWLIDGADRVVAPSEDVALRMLRYFPNANIIVAPHPS